MPIAKKPTATAKKPREKAAAPSGSTRRGKTVAQYVATLSAPQRANAQKLLDLVDNTAPLATACIKWAQPVWELEGPFAWMRGAKSHLSFGFWRGAELADRSGLLEGTGNRMRHVKLRDEDELPARELAVLIKEAAALNRTKGDPTRDPKKSGR